MLHKLTELRYKNDKEFLDL